MDKINKRQYRINGHKNDAIGIPLGIHDKNGVELKTGDKIRWYDEDCIILWNRPYKCYSAMLLRSNWYGDHNEYNADSYGKAYNLVMDDGARMEMELIS